MDNKKSILKAFLRLATITFACTVLAMSVAGWLAGDIMEGSPAVLIPIDAGLSHFTIFQILVFSLINSGLTVFLGIVLKKLMYMWQLITIMFACLVASAALAVAFQWLSFDSLGPWLQFAGSFAAVFIILAIIMVTKTRLKDKQYEKLLSDYKAKQKNPEESI